MFKLVISDTVEFSVKFAVNDGGKTRHFSFGLTGNRLSQEEIDRRRGDESTINDLLEANLTGWRGQALVLDGDDKPAAFSIDALRAMLAVRGVPHVIVAAYLEACDARGKEKN